MWPARVFKKIKFLTALILFLFISSSAFSEPHIISITIEPPAPDYGDRITVTVEYCAQRYADHELAIAISTLPVPADARLSGIGQVFIVSSAGMNNHVTTPAANPGGEIGVTAMTQAQAQALPDNCDTGCGGNGTNATLNTVVYGDDEILTMPSPDMFPGCDIEDFYVHVVMKDANLNDGEYHTQLACASGTDSWSVPVRPTDFSMHKRAEGVVETNNDLLLFSIDYEYANGQLQIWDAIPSIPGGSFTLEAVGPQSIVGGTVTTPCAPPCSVSPGQQITWLLPQRSNPPTSEKGSVNGTVWFLLRVVDPDPPDLVTGGLIANTANGRIIGPDGTYTDSSSANVRIGEVVMTLTKSQAMSTVEFGDNVTYYLDYEVNGAKLVAYEPFDDLAIGTYTSTPPDGWNFLPESVGNGTWYIEDPCNTGDRVIRGDTLVNNHYPGLLIDRQYTTAGCLSGTQVVTDVLIDPSGEVTGSGYEGSDSLVIIRSNGISGTGGRAYGLVLSVDDFIGTNNTGNIGFQRCGGTPYGSYTAGDCMWPESIDTLDISGNTWYRVKIEVMDEKHFQAKVWPKGDPEPGWMIEWEDTQADATYDCASGPWYPGIAEQGGANATTQDSYNNFIVYEPRVFDDVTLYDTVPIGVTYQGANGEVPPFMTGPTNPNMVAWDLGQIWNEGGSYTWWARVDTCDPITNIAAIDGDGQEPVHSNEIITYPICPTPEITIDKTADPMIGGIGDQITFTIVTCNVSTVVAQDFSIWDNVPPLITFGGFVSASNGFNSHGPSGGTIWWDRISNPDLPAGQCVTVVWWGTINGVPENPFTTEKYFAVRPHDTELYVLKQMLVKK